MTLELYDCVPLTARLTARACAINQRNYRTAPSWFPLLHACKDCPGIPARCDSASGPPEKAVKHPVPFNHPGAQPTKGGRRFPQISQGKETKRPPGAGAPPLPSVAPPEPLRGVPIGDWGKGLSAGVKKRLLEELARFQGGKISRGKIYRLAAAYNVPIESIREAVKCGRR